MMCHGVQLWNSIVSVRDNCVFIYFVYMEIINRGLDFIIQKVVMHNLDGIL